MPQPLNIYIWLLVAILVVFLLWQLWHWRKDDVRLARAANMVAITTGLLATIIALLALLDAHSSGAQQEVELQRLASVESRAAHALDISQKALSQNVDYARQTLLALRASRQALAINVSYSKQSLSELQVSSAIQLRLLTAAGSALRNEIAAANKQQSILANSLAVSQKQLALVLTQNKTQTEQLKPQLILSCEALLAPPSPPNDEATLFVYEDGYKFIDAEDIKRTLTFDNGHTYWFVGEGEACSIANVGGSTALDVTLPFTVVTGFGRPYKTFSAPVVVPPLNPHGQPFDFYITNVGTLFDRVRIPDPPPPPFRSSECSWVIPDVTPPGQIPRHTGVSPENVPCQHPNAAANPQP